MSNFSFLKDDFNDLFFCISKAEQEVISDPNTAIIKIGQFAELITKRMIQIEEIKVEEGNQVNYIKKLKIYGLLNSPLDDILHRIRLKRNLAIHENYNSEEEAKILLNHAFTFAVWFYQLYGDYRFEPSKYIEPNLIILNYDKQVAEEIELSNSLEKSDLFYINFKSNKTKEKLLEIEGNKEVILNKINNSLTEAQTRDLIDQKLRLAGWEADTNNIRQSKGNIPQKGKNKAIAEWQTDSGPVDYALFIGLKLVGIIEAKKQSKNVYATIDDQCKRYATTIKDEDLKFVEKTYGEYRVPFVFSTNGKKYFKELEHTSGIWFKDVRVESNIQKPLEEFYSPQNIIDLLKIDKLGANEKLKNGNEDYLTNSGGLQLRYYQYDAIKSVEKSIINGQENILLSMATGTGKTRTALGIIYKLLKTERFNRILFLVDRTTLGEQAKDTFDDVKIEKLQTLRSIYPIATLEDDKSSVDESTRVHIATVQSFVHRIFKNNSNDLYDLNVGDYDCIIVDEAHRGYTLDKTMSKDEIEYRNQKDFASKYRKVIEYFNATKIALTATPAVHTSDIFGKPVYNYTYREAVIDGYLVDHDLPLTINTTLNTEGLKYEKGENITTINPFTNELENSEELDDEITFDIEKFNKKIIVPDFNNKVLEEVTNYIDPFSEEKTLIFAVNDNHADMIVKILKEKYFEQELHSDAIMKITGSIHNGDSEKIQKEIKKFKNERYPNIVVTVDLLTTGVDIPKVCNLVFMRLVRSRILYEQMLGRATRLCTDINKEKFRIIDCVGLYKFLEDVTNMKPVVQTNTVNMETLFEELDVVSDEQKRVNVEKIIAKLHRKKNQLNDDQKSIISSFIKESGTDETGHTIQDIINYVQEELRADSISNAVTLAKKFEKAIKYVDSVEILSNNNIYYSNKKDTILEVTKGYGKYKKPEDYLESFNQFINENKDKIEALKILLTSPSTLTREQLKSIRLKMIESDFTEEMLKDAFTECNDVGTTANIIQLIRNLALKEDVEDIEFKVKRAVKKIEKELNLNQQQKNWLQNISKSVMAECVLDKELFNGGHYKRTFGGYDKLDKKFDNKLDRIIFIFNTELYEKVAN